MEITDIIQQIVDGLMSNFDITYCLVVNILTYISIKLLDEVNKSTKSTTWIKRGVLLVAILSTGVLYCALGSDVKVIVNSAILAPVAWSWIFKPICAKLGIDYKKINNILNE